MCVPEERASQVMQDLIWFSLLFSGMDQPPIISVIHSAHDVVLNPDPCQEACALVLKFLF